MKRVHIGGKSPATAHSYRDFSTTRDALAYMWAMAKVPHPERCWLFQGLDGWLGNVHMRNKDIPQSLAPLIQAFMDEDALATAGG